MVTSFDWLDLSKLDGVDQDIREVFAGAEEFIDKERVEAIVASVNQRVQLLATFILTQQPQMLSSHSSPRWIPQRTMWRKMRRRNMGWGTNSKKRNYP